MIIVKINNLQFKFVKFFKNLIIQNRLRNKLKK